MIDPFVTALNALFNAPGSVAAGYWSVSGETANIRMIRNQPTELSTFGQSQAAIDTNSFMIRKSEVRDPQRGDVIVFDTTTWNVNAAPMLDSEGLTWMISASLVPDAD